MKAPANAVDLYLAPGEFHFSDQPTRMRTLLGSCIAIVLWHPTRKMGGMCHCMLPTRERRGTAPDGRYIDEALALFKQQASARHSSIDGYQLKLFGGGSMFTEQRRDLMGGIVARMNVVAAQQFAVQSRLVVSGQDVGGSGHRNIIFDTWSGHVWVRHTSLKTAETNDEKDKGTGR
jgi:chemotaxis protein CheD